MASRDPRKAAAALEKLSIVEATQHDPKTTTPRPNLPLPRELREHVYSYLLHHENVREAPYHTRSKSARGKVGYGWANIAALQY